jgi:dolichol-phosphate mannosyltransferase
MTTNSLTIAIPLYNESKTIQYLYEQLDKAKDAIPTSNLKILLVDDGSTDNTFELLNKYFLDFKNCTIIQHNSNLNLNGFINTAINNCDTEYIVFLDSDCTFDPMYIPEMISLVNEDIDIVNGSPYHPNGSVEGVKKGRLVISNGANYIYRILINKNIFTYTSIFKLYRTSVIKEMSIETSGFVSVSELFIKSILNGARVIEFPCVLQIRKYGDSKIRILNSINNHIKFMLSLVFTK